MIQRIQTLYLFFVTVLMVGIVVFPVMEVINNEQSHTINLLALGAYSYVPGITLPALAILIAALAFTNIFLYTKRSLQIQICCWILALILLLYGFIFYSYVMLGEAMGDNMIVFPEIAVAFPLVGLFLVGMSILRIRKDERLVSFSGLRSR